MAWPFKDMKEGEVRVLWDVIPGKAANAAHACGRYYGWKFKTATCEEEDGRKGLVVKRLKNPAGTPAEPDARNKRYVHYEYESLEVGDSFTYTDVPWFLAQVLNSVQYRERKHGKKWKRKVTLDPDTRQYKSVKLTRIV